MKLNKKAILSTVGAALVIAVALVGCGAHKSNQKAKSTQPKSNATSQAFKEDKDKNQNKDNSKNDSDKDKGKPNLKKTGKTKEPKANKAQKKPVLKTKHPVVKNNLKNKQAKNNKQVPKKAKVNKVTKGTKNPQTKVNNEKKIQSYQYINRYVQTPQGQKMVARTNYNHKKHTANVYLQPKFMKQLKNLDKKCKNLPKMNKHDNNAKVAQNNKNQSQQLLSQATKLNKEINNTLLVVKNKQAKGLKLRVVNGHGKSLAQINKHGLDLQRNIQNVYKHDIRKLLALNKNKKVNPKLKKSMRNTQQTK